MKFYPVGQRVRVMRVHCSSLRYLEGMTGTVASPPRVCTSRKRWWLKPRSWIGQSVAIDGIGTCVPDPESITGLCEYWPKPEDLQPLDDDKPATSSWDEVQKITNWAPASPTTANGDQR